ncbi:MAG: hypothetical protein L0Z50_12965 [Verrucomicrobiales bacterium]|nr:hypothetical protein [Verrucomicrobiales bacterium]
MKTRALVLIAWISLSSVLSLAAIRSESNPRADATGKTVSAGIAEVLKMAERGVDSSVIKSFVENYSVAYHPNADEIIALHDAGISSEIITALLRRTGELRAKQIEANNRAAAQRSEIRRPAVAAAPQNRVQTVVPQPTTPAYQVNYVYPSSYVYPTYPTYSYSYALPFYYSSAYCRPYRYSYWPRTHSWPSWPSWPSYGLSVGFRSSYGLGVGFRSGYCARPTFGFHSYPRHASRFVCR